MTSPTSLLVDFALLFGELLALFLLVAFVVALAARRIGVSRLGELMGGGRVRAALKGIGLGFVTPFCTYSAIPLLVGMLGAGARPSATAGFLLAAPLLDPLVFAAIVVLFGPSTALAYALAGFATVLLAALLADAARLDRWVARMPRPVVGGSVEGCAPGAEPDCSDPFTDPARWRGLRPEAGRAFPYAVDLLSGMLRPLVIAVALATLIAGVIPQGAIASVAGAGNPLAVPAAALMGAPFYVSAEALVPVAAALADQGMSTGAVFALVVAGAGVNIPELLLLSRILRPRLLAGYIAAVFGVAVTCGYLVPGLLHLLA